MRLFELAFVGDGYYIPSIPKENQVSFHSSDLEWG